MNRVIKEHQEIWEDFHRPVGITLEESKADWLEMLIEDPEMKDIPCWGLLAGTVSSGEIEEFRSWLETH